VVWKLSNLAYNRRETREKRLLGRDPDRSLCHLHTSLKCFWSQSVPPWTSTAAYECAAAQSMDPWGATQKALQERSGDTSSCPAPYPTVACLEFHFGCRLGRELFTVPVFCPLCSWSHGLRPKKLYHTRGVAVTPALFWFTNQRPLVPS